MGQVRNSLASVQSVNVDGMFTCRNQVLDFEVIKI